jgi:ABC-type phosphate transport system substrate-binding protein
VRHLLVFIGAMWAALGVATATATSAGSVARAQVRGEAPGPSGGDVAVAVHRDVPIDALTMSELRRIMLGDREFWPGSTRIVILMRAPVSHERDVILKNICEMTEAQFRQHWIGKVFRADVAVGPKIVYSAETSLDLVNRTPGAITFVDASLAKGPVKIVRVDGHLPGESGYPLR